MELPKEDPSNCSSSGYGTRTGTSSPRKLRSCSLSIQGSNPFHCPLTQSDFDLAALRKQILSAQEKGTTVENAVDTESAPSPSQFRRRARSAKFVGTNPLDTPLTDTEYQLSAYQKKLNQEREQEERFKQALTAQVIQSTDPPLPSVRESLIAPRTTQSTRPPLPTPLEQPSTAKTTRSTRLPLPPSYESPLTPRTTQSTRRRLTPLPELPFPSRRLQLTSENDIPNTDWQQTRDYFTSDKREKNKRDAEKKSDIRQFIQDKKDAYKARFEKFESSKPTSKVVKRAQLIAEMNYQNYIDSPGVGPSASPRQAPPSPSQGMNHPNGMNGGGGMGVGGMVGYPTPAGHQSDLNYIMSMVEDLSAVLRQNQLLTASVVEKVGKVREKASTMNLTNDELIAAVASELHEDTKNLEKENSELRKALEKAEYDKKENWKLACHGANILADVTEKMHKFREQTDADIHAWHKNYRQQLLAEREENLALRNQINDMKAAACRANEHLRQMRRYVTDHDELHELTVQNIALRQEKRLWKRMALKHLPDDDSEWSDDDDLIDPEEKKRQAALKDAEKERKEKEDNEGGEGTSA